MYVKRVVCEKEGDGKRGKSRTVKKQKGKKRKFIQA